MHKHCGSCVSLNGRFLVDSVAINFDDHEQTVLKNYEIGLNTAITFTATNEYGKGRK